jgi:Ca-activated chloride channel family protein
VTKLDAVSIEQPLSIKAAEGVTVDVPLNAGVLATTIGDGDYLEVFAPKKDIQGNRKSFGGSYGPTISRTLPAGDYHLVLTVANDGGTKEADATVKAGERTETTLP